MGAKSHASDGVLGGQGAMHHLRPHEELMGHCMLLILLVGVVVYAREDCLTVGKKPVFSLAVKCMCFLCNQNLLFLAAIVINSSACISYPIS